MPPGKREMNLVSSGNSGDGILFSGRGTASGASKMQLSSSAQGFGFSSNTHGSRGSHNSRTENTNTQQITKTTRTYNRFGSSSSNGGEGGAGMIQTTTETRTEKRFGRGSQNSRDGSRDNGSTGRGAGLQMSTNGRSIQINSETVKTPFGASNERRKLKIESEKVTEITASNERRQMKIESEKVNVPTASNERRRIKIKNRKRTSRSPYRFERKKTS